MFSALAYPALELVSVPARRTYAQPARPFMAAPPAGEAADGAAAALEALSLQQRADDVLDIADMAGFGGDSKRVVETRLYRGVHIGSGNAAAALEVMSRFAADPHWLIYLPPTMSPSETSARADLLEHPAEAFAYFRNNGVAQVVCEEKHMGSRAVVVVCRNEDAARRRFGLPTASRGMCYTRTGRPFFQRADWEAEFLRRVAAAITNAGLWEEFATDWFCLDCELMPWSAKAQGLLREHYAAVGSSTVLALSAAVANLEAAGERMDVSA